MEPILPSPENNNTIPAAPLQPSTETAANSQPEQSHETPPQPSATPQAAPLPAVQPVQAVTLSTPPAQTSTPAVVDEPVVADDVDVIEKEWVDKAKKIVDKTKADPHEQEKEVSKLQADYLMKRYNKQLKVTE